MSFDPELAKFALAVLNVLGTLGVAAYTCVATRDKDNSQHIKAVEKALSDVIGAHASRIDRMEIQMRYMPTPEQITELRGDVQAMQATQEAIQRDMQAMRLATNRIEDFLLKKK